MPHIQQIHSLWYNSSQTDSFLSLCIFRSKHKTLDELDECSSRTSRTNPNKLFQNSILHQHIIIITESSTHNHHHKNRIKIPVSNPQKHTKIEPNFAVKSTDSQSKSRLGIRSKSDSQGAVTFLV
jgi:hypothetical protein